MESGIPSAAFMDFARRYTSLCCDARLTVDAGDDALALLLIMLSFPTKGETDLDPESRSFSARVFPRSLTTLPMMFVRVL